MKVNSPTVILELCLVVIFLATSINPTADVPEKKNCIVSVTEGKIHVMTFYLERNRQLVPDSFHAHLRRKKNDGVDILTCDAKNGNISCILEDDAFQLEIAGKHTLNVRVTNLTSELEDTYILQVFVNGTKEPPFVCNLNEMASDIGNGANNGGIIGGAIAGVLGVIIIIIVVIVILYKRHGCGRKADGAANTTQAEEPLVMMNDNTCKNKGSPTKEKDPLVEGTSAASNSNTMTDDNACKNKGSPTKEKDPLFDGTSAASDSNTMTDDNACKNKGSPTKEKDPLVAGTSAASDSNTAGQPINAEQLSSSKGNSLEKIRDRTEGEKRSSPTSITPLNETGMPQPETKDELDSQGYPRYYYRKLSDVEENSLLLSEKNGPGSFLIKGTQDPNRFILSVNSNGQVVRCPFRCSRSKYSFSHRFFDTMDELTEHYKKHDIAMTLYDGLNIARLVRPVEDQNVRPGLGNSSPNY